MSKKYAKTYNLRTDVRICKNMQHKFWLLNQSIDGLWGHSLTSCTLFRKYQIAFYAKSSRLYSLIYYVQYLSVITHCIKPRA